VRPTRTRESHLIVVWRGSRSTGALSGWPLGEPRSLLALRRRTGTVGRRVGGGPLPARPSRLVPRGRVGGEYAMERWVAPAGTPERVSRHGGRDPRGASPSASLGPCRSRACPVDYLVRERVRNPDDPDEVAGVPGAGGCGAGTGYWASHSADRRGDQRARESPAGSMQRGAASRGEATVA
jgi:hypothetical protein